MKVTYIDHMGSDLSVVNAARVSFGKRSDWEREVVGTPHEGYPTTITKVKGLSEADAKLIRYLAKHNHWTPFGHTAVTLHVKAPLFVARQLGKHQVGLVWNEVSRRYVDDEPEFYVPETWRKRADNVKQGSSDEPVEDTFGWAFAVIGENTIQHATSRYNTAALDHYKALLDHGVCPEQARMVLPQSIMTEWYWTGSIAAFSRVCKLRLDSHTQRETQEVAQQISDTIAPLFPVSWEALQCGK